MRFAISLLVLIAIASIIGTVLHQNEPLPNYINQFGPFWFEVFRDLSLYGLYTSWWFLLVMVFLVSSTSLCLIRNAPKMVKDMRSWRDNVREQSLHNFAHKAEWHSAQSRTALAQRLQHDIGRRGYQTKIVDKTDATLITAKKGAANKLGYIFAHSAIIIILVGGTLDSDLAIKFQQWFMDKRPYDGGGLISQIPAQHRLAAGTPTFRGNTSIPEGQTSSTTLIPEPNGMFVQDLPFSIRLKKFNIEYYSTGMPRLFASEVDIIDPQAGKTFPAVIKVNEPLTYRGISIYQSSVDDGGSRLVLNAYPMKGPSSGAREIKGEVGTATQLGGDGEFTIEWTGFRPINVENLQTPGEDLRSVKKSSGLADDLAATLHEHSGSSAKGTNTKNLHNVGPSVQYKLRDRNGQAREFSNYMLPVQIEGNWVFLAGLRESPSEPFKYLRIPADDNDSVQEWMRLRAAIADPSLRAKAATQYADNALPDNQDGRNLRAPLAASAQKALDIFAGNDKIAGYNAVGQFLDQIPADKRENATNVFLKILDGTIWDLLQVARQRDGLAPLDINDRHARFLQLATRAVSDSYFYNAPIYLQLTSFDEIKASVFQVTRSPGKIVVYIGCLLLVAGIFSMFYIRERRVWVWLTDAADQSGCNAIMAMSTQRKTLDFEREYDQLKLALTQDAANQAGA